MSTKVREKLHHFPSAYITHAELITLLNGSANSRYGQIKYALANGDLIRIKRGLYCLGERLRLKQSHPFELAQYIYGPS